MISLPISAMYLLLYDITRLSGGVRRYHSLVNSPTFAVRHRDDEMVRVRLSS
jgi:hypothetical protein